MNIPETLYRLRTARGMSQEALADALGVSRQAVSKWETDETLPDIRQSKRMALLYKISLDELIDFDLEVQEIQEAIEKTRDAVVEKIDWTKAWSKKYPILARYQWEVDTVPYAWEISTLLDDLKAKYGYNELDAMLVLKDILAGVWKSRKSSGKR